MRRARVMAHGRRHARSVRRASERFAGDSAGGDALCAAQARTRRGGGCALSAAAGSATAPREQPAATKQHPAVEMLCFGRFKIRTGRPAAGSRSLRACARDRVRSDVLVSGASTESAGPSKGP
jgi:hypothetical protein